MRKFLFALVVALAISGSAEAKRARHPGWGSNGPFGWTYTCLFPKHGLVLIDTREPWSSITYRGRKYPATGGSYFYVGRDDPDIMVMFGPNMRFWDFGSYGDRATSCTRRKNLR